MRKSKIFVLAAALLVLAARPMVWGEAPQSHDTTDTPSKLMVLWTSGDREVALKMVFMYTFNAKKRGWWDDIRFVIWGPSSKLLSGDAELQTGIKEMQEAGVVVEACKACADLYGVSDKLSALGIEVKYMGVPLTEMLKSGWTSLTF
jgi:hypothetical protein